MGSMAYAVLPIILPELLFFAPLFSLHEEEKVAKAKVYCPMMLNRMEPVEVSASQRPPEVPSGTLTDPVEDLA